MRIGYYVRRATRIFLAKVGAKTLMSEERDYVLGTHDDEIDRLGLQHRVWRPFVTDAWRRAGFSVGQKLIDVGCGPGYATLDLAEIVGPAGEVWALERSNRFLDALRTTAQARALMNIQPFEVDLETDAFPCADADGAWCRWVVAFMHEPLELLSKIHRALKPGGVFVSHEYCDYRSWRVSPRSEVFESFVDAVIKSWRNSGGDPDVGIEMPRWLERTGFELVSVSCIQQFVGREDYMWQWPIAFLNVGLERLCDLGEVDEQFTQAMRTEIRRIESEPGIRFLTPSVAQIVARRR